MFMVVMAIVKFDHTCSITSPLRARYRIIIVGNELVSSLRSLIREP